MRTRHLVPAALIAWTMTLLSLSAMASSLRVQVVDQSGAPLVDAVVYVAPTSGKLPARPPADGVIDQFHRQFTPLVTVIQTGGSIRFPNKDDFEHDVYSFSPAKKFELNLYHGVKAPPVQFDKPGLVVMGCNIHDQMLAYLLVVDTPYFAKTDASGIATVDGLPSDTYQVTAWHYRLADDAARPTQKIAISGDTSVKFVVNLKPESP